MVTACPRSAGCRSVGAYLNTARSGYLRRLAAIWAADLASAMVTANRAAAGGRGADVDAALALAEAQLGARSGPARAASEAERSFDASLEAQRRAHEEQLRAAAAEAIARNEAAMTSEVPQLAAEMRAQLGELSIAQRSAVLAALIAAAAEVRSERQLRQQEAMVELLEQHREHEQAAKEHAAAAPDAPDAPGAPDAKEAKAQAAQAAQLKALHDKLRIEAESKLGCAPVVPSEF